MSPCDTHWYEPPSNGASQLEILSGVHAVPGIAWSCVYLIEDDILALVDTGFPWSAKAVLDYIASIGRRPDELGYILLTHGHPDHTASALDISRRTGAQIATHAGDTKTHADSTVSLDYMGVFGSLKVPLPFLQWTPVGRTVADGETLPLLGGISVIHTPGHTSGSTCYLVKSRKVLFSGDTLFSDGRRISRSVPFPGYDERCYRASLNRLAALEFDVVCGGHGAPLIGGASDELRKLLRVRPDPPSWLGVLKSIPARLRRSGHWLGEYY